MFGEVLNALACVDDKKHQMYMDEKKRVLRSRRGRFMAAREALMALAGHFGIDATAAAQDEKQ